MYYVYVLCSSKLDQFYRGQTSDIEDRLKRHNGGEELATRAGSPWSLIWYTKKASRSEALVFEKKLKHLSRVKLIRLMKKYDEFYSGAGEHPTA